MVVCIGLVMLIMLGLAIHNLYEPLSPEDEWRVRRYLEEDE